MKGEKIVSVLCKALVNPARADVWPRDWPLPHEALNRKPVAVVQAVYLHDDGIWLLLSNLYTGQMTESKATGWLVEQGYSR